MVLHVKIPVLMGNIRIMGILQTLSVVIVIANAQYVRDLTLINAVNVNQVIF